MKKASKLLGGAALLLAVAGIGQGVQGMQDDGRTAAQKAIDEKNEELTRLSETSAEMPVEILGKKLEEIRRYRGKTVAEREIDKKKQEMLDLFGEKKNRVKNRVERKEKNENKSKLAAEYKIVEGVWKLYEKTENRYKRKTQTMETMYRYGKKLNFTKAALTEAIEIFFSELRDTPEGEAQENEYNERRHVEIEKWDGNIGNGLPGMKRDINARLTAWLGEREIRQMYSIDKKYHEWASHFSLKMFFKTKK
jgi:hypothetical protein